MKIGLIISEFPSVSETFILDHALFLADSGFDIAIFSGTRGRGVASGTLLSIQEKFPHIFYAWSVSAGGIGGKLARSALTAVHISGKQPSWVRAFLRLRDYHPRMGLISLRALDLMNRPEELSSCDLVHAHYGPNGSMAVFLRDLGRFSGPVVTSFHGHDINVLPRRFGRNMYVPLFAKGDLFLVNSDFAKNRLVELGCPEGKVVKIPVGVDLAKFSFRSRSLKMGERLEIVTVARLVEVKGLQYALRAMTALREAGIDFRYKIVGDGPLRHALERLTRELGLEAQVVFLGRQSHHKVRDILQDSHLFVLPSIKSPDGAEETQGLSLIEAQAVGMPVIATRVGGLPESLQDGSSGFLAPPGDPEGMAMKLLELARNPSSWEEMGRRGREYVQQKFAQSLLFERMAGEYRQVLSSYHKSGASVRTHA